MATKIIKKLAFAKLNLFIYINNKRLDRFHNIVSLFHKIDLYDEIIVELKPTLTISIDKDLGITNENNLVYKAAILLQNYANCNKGAAISIKKRIPLGAGLGGGSSDAATTLLLLNDIWELNLTNEELLSIAVELGSDVPFFLHDDVMLVSGRGEILEKINFNLNCWYLLVYPNINCNTGQMYKKLDRKTDFLGKDIEYAKEIIHKAEFGNNFSKIKELLYNDFEMAINDEKELSELQMKLNAISNGYSCMTGSGSCFFALFSTKYEAEQAKIKLLQYKKYWTYIGKINNHLTDLT